MAVHVSGLSQSSLPLDMTTVLVAVAPESGRGGAVNTWWAGVRVLVRGMIV